MSKTIKLFGYGSLINEKSLKETCPSASNIFPAKIKGFIRIFNVYEDKQFTLKNTGKRASLNLDKSEVNPSLNGICFEISTKEFEELQEREHQYELVQVEVEDFNNSKNIYKAYVWRAKHFEAYDYQFNSKVQKEYLDLCLDGCKNFGEKFLEEFKKTTYIGKKTLKELNM